MAFIRIACQAGDNASGARLPVGSVQAGECRDEVDASVVLYGSGKCLDIRALFHQAEVIAHPLHQRTGYGDAALECVGRGLTAEPIGGCRQQPIFGRDRFGAGIH